MVICSQQENECETCELRDLRMSLRAFPIVDGGLNIIIQIHNSVPFKFFYHVKIFKFMDLFSIFQF